MLKASIPMSAATLTTSRLVDVPMVVAMPPRMLAKPIGISDRRGRTGSHRHADQDGQHQHHDGRVVDERRSERP